jgi:hypothetical protein
VVWPWAYPRIDQRKKRNARTLRGGRRFMAGSVNMQLCQEAPFQ